jgi:hypothetical protein
MKKYSVALIQEQTPNRVHSQVTLYFYSKWGIIQEASNVTAGKILYVPSGLQIAMQILIIHIK